MTRLAPRFLLAFPLLAACPATTPEDAMPYCEDTRTEIAPDEATALGITANDVLAGLPAEETATFRYVDGGSTALTVAFTPGAQAYFVESVEVYPETDGPSPAIAVVCDDRIEIDGSLAFATADGAFAESLAATLTATADALALREELDLDALVGSFAIEPFVTAEDYDAVEAWISIRFVDGQSEGAVEGQASGTSACDDEAECTAWAENVEVGDWSNAAEE
jgi:hypothetical protein